MDLKSLKGKVTRYKKILKNTKDYRASWATELKPMIIKTLEEAIKTTKMNAKVDVKDEIENLEVVALSMGHKASGIAEKIPDSDSKRPFLKSNGALIYQQLFNGKVMIMIMYPFIENYGQPRPPRTLEILRPEEFRETYIIKHIEEFFKDLIDWEDYDDDLPENMSMSPIGFVQPTIPEEAD